MARRPAPALVVAVSLLVLVLVLLNLDAAQGQPLTNSSDGMDFSLALTVSSCCIIAVGALAAGITRGSRVPAVDALNSVFRQWRLDGDAAGLDPCPRLVLFESLAMNASVGCDCSSGFECRISHLCVVFTPSPFLLFTAALLALNNVIHVRVWNLSMMQECDWVQEHHRYPAGALQLDGARFSVSLGIMVDVAGLPTLNYLAKKIVLG